MSFIEAGRGSVAIALLVLLGAGCSSTSANAPDPVASETTLPDRSTGPPDTPVSEISDTQAIQGERSLLELLGHKDARVRLGAARALQAVEGADVAIIANNHPELASWRPRQMLRVMAESGFIYDYWNHFSDLRPYELGPSYFAVGNTGTRDVRVHG